MEQDVRKLGYSQEEEYFYRKNKELIENSRKERDAERAAQEARARKQAHWMKCPKCGSDLQEIEHLGIKVDRCSGCSGIFFDKGELETLLQTHEPNGFLGGLRKIFK
ncbi:MAG: zf-TFIIB domain-containing protein [Nitrospirae bacterium]|nr:zf-TFIIB domain-containing protein [Candidatus Manganitrophaceae bacterium]